jgi:hypothetical protein
MNTEAIEITKLGAVSGAHVTEHDVPSVFAAVHSGPFCCRVHDRHVQQTAK